MQNTPKEKAQEAPRVPHDIVAYALGVKYSLVYNVRSGRRTDHYGIIEFVESLEKTLEITREQNLSKRAEAKIPVTLQASN